MATAFTHGFVAAALLPLAPRQVPRWRLLVVLVLLSMVPDADVVTFRMGISYADPFGHRGFTHSLAFAVVAGVLAALCFYRYVRPWSVRGAWLAGLCFAATALHGVLDAMTDAGLGVAFFFPVDNTRYFLPWRPLTASPVGIASFFKGEAAAILRNEMFWVWAPVTVMTMWGYVLRRWIKSRVRIVGNRNNAGQR